MNETPLVFSIAPDVAIPFSQITQVDEEGLLPGLKDLPQSFGYLPLLLDNNDSEKQVKFDAINMQENLLNSNLCSGGKPLYYTLSEDGKILNAYAGEQGECVFNVKLDASGTYHFILHGHIDRGDPPNLFANQSETGFLPQHIITEAHVPYQLTFYTHHCVTTSAIPEPLEQIQIFWDNQLISVINTHALEAKGYTFSVEGNADHHTTELKFVGIGGQANIDNYIHHVSLINTSQNQLLLDFKYLVSDSNNHDTHVSTDHFGVNVTTTPPIILNNQLPFEIIYDQSVYQTIIVNDENTQNNPLATLHLDSLFQNLAIDPQNRVVDIVQLEKGGQATNVYEVQISDKSETHTLEPITIADIQLSFPGGEGGIGVFQKNILIDEGSDFLSRDWPI